MAPASADKTVSTVGRCHVKPTKHIGTKEFQFTTFDLPYLAFYYNQKLMLYNGGPDFDFDAMVTKMKRGLEIVIEDFYPLAGKIAADDGVYFLKYDDDMQGIEVAEAVAEEVTVADVSSFDDTSAILQFLPCNGTPNLDGVSLPLVSIQLTKLADGVAVGCAFNHAVLDGASTWHFMGSWAEACSKTITKRPTLERTMRIAPVKLGPYLAAVQVGTEEPKSCTKDRVFRFSSEAIARIKKTANADTCPAEGGKPFSTFQSLGAHIWRSVSRARGLKAEDLTVFAVFMDCRRRMEPPVPESYFGNAIHAVFTHATAGALGGGPAAVGATLIQRAVEAHDGKAIEERNLGWERDPKVFQYRDAGVNCVVVGSSPRFRVYDVDFGWGRAAAVRGGGNNRFDGMVYLYAGKEGGESIDVEITLEEGAMEHLKKDEGFLGQDVI